MQPPINTKNTPPKLLISKANAPPSEEAALDLKNLDVIIITLHTHLYRTPYSEY